MTVDGRIVTGKVANLMGNSLLLMKSALDPADLVTVPRDQIEEQTWSNVSQMPSNLFDTFTAEEIADLIAFLSQSGATK